LTVTMLSPPRSISTLAGTVTGILPIRDIPDLPSRVQTETHPHF